MSERVDRFRADRFRSALARNAAGVHGPVPAEQAAKVCAERVVELAGAGAVAVPALDLVLEPLGVLAALAGTGLALVGPDTPAWLERVAGAAVGVTGAVAGIAETGTVALVCGPGAPRAVSLLPDAHVCVVQARDLYDDVPEAVAAVVGRPLPPALVWVSGPSRSADLEKRITLGVHGPRTFEVIVVED